KGHGDFFSEVRNALPHSIERQLGLKIHPRAAHMRPAAATVAFFACPVEFIEGNPIQQGQRQL
ncbi:MAG: hypothetical protein QGG48_11570, partial [Desulfatiglandales bacterium]|nr:hypothetical protein [Desulfatiglandales bacterium]